MRRRVLLTGLVPLTMAMGFSVLANGEDVEWPGWMGPKRDGWVDYFTAPAEWPSALERAWRVEVGTGYGSPLVTGDCVFQHARQGDEEVVWCLDLATGEEKWRQSYRVDFEMGRGGYQHGKGPKSSPTLADGRLFTMSITGVLSAWDGDTGKLLWRRDFTERFEKGYPYWGAATSPLADAGRVYVHPGSCEEGALLALDAESGREIWSRADSGHCYSSPLLVELEGVRQIVEWNHDGLSGVDCESGVLLWDYSFPHHGQNQNTPTPTVVDGLVIVGGENRGMRCVKPVRKDGEWTVEERWRHRDVALDMSSAVVNEGLLFGLSHFKTGQYFCLDPKSGEVRWTGEPRAAENAMFLSMPGHVLSLVDHGELQILAADGKALRMVKTYRVAEGDTWAPPVVLGDGFLVKDKAHLTRWKLAAGN